MLLCAAARAEEAGTCAGAPLTGIVRDTTSALISGASLTLDTQTTLTSASNGTFTFPCVAPGEHSLHITATTFADRELALSLNTKPRSLTITLEPHVDTTVDVAADDTAQSSNSAGSTQTISGSRLAELSDDPDELQTELQQMAASNGGSPGNATISVDGFQDSSHLPPKSSIAYIKVNPDLFSSEYREPPFDGGRIEVYTKPGQPTYHGALFANNSSPWMNARQPFSTAVAPIGRQRYGFELSGPIRKKGSDFSLSLEHRDIAAASTINAVTLSAAGTPVSTTGSIETPQALWSGLARTSWQLGPKNTFIASYSANVNSLQNLGVGGTTLAEAGYDSHTWEHAIRLTDVTTISAKLMHEARVSFKWEGDTAAPHSTAPSVAVAGAFTGGGASVGPERFSDFLIEVDDDAILNTGKHLLKFGTQLFINRENNQMTANFNGAYTFGGGTAPTLDASGQPTAQTTTITGLEQYRRAQLGLAGGSPTAYSSVSGTPTVAYVKTADALFFQDDWKIRKNVTASLGLRYFLQNDPETYSGITPRFGIAWSPDKKATWTLHGHAGLFTGFWGTRNYNELLREDGIQRITSTVYNPAFGKPFTSGATVIHSMRTLSPHFNNITFSIENVGFTKALPHGWNINSDFFIARIWNFTRSVNINSPLNGSPTGPRPIAPNLNILELNNSGQGGGDVQFFSIEQHTLKHVQFFAGAVRVNVFDDTGNGSFNSPQSSTSDAGEFARRAGNPLWNAFGNATFKLPRKVDLSANMRAMGGRPYNVTTGFDNNGDGNFNDRPQYALPGDPNAIATPFGLLVAQGGTGVLPRNVGIMPWAFYLDLNVQHVFKISRNAKAEHPQTLTANIRSTNALNHTNVESVGSVLGSPLFGRAYASDDSRRFEGGLRYSF